MKNKLILFAVAAGLSLGLHLSAFGREKNTSHSLQTLTENAMSADSEIAADAIKRLRAEGPAGLDALFAAHAALIEEHDIKGSAGLSAHSKAAWLRLQDALDSVGAQHDCAASRLYWYTNLDDAKAVAKAGGKPILSLRLLGKLNEEYSCANSRYFRATLYANAEVSRYLREHFVLHWQSERPAPRITVDFGDGRKIERTITGNSIHYILAADGRLIDALPGLYGPQAFLNELADAEGAALQYAKLSESAQNAPTASAFDCIGHPLQNPKTDPGQFLRQYHREHADGIKKAFNADVAELRARAFNLPANIPDMQSLRNADEVIWAGLATLHSKDAVLDRASVRLISSKNPTAVEAMRATTSKNFAESPLTYMLQNLSRSIAEDTVRNEYLFHWQIHEWLATGAAPEDLNQFNSLVYDKLFLTPESDPWLGLAPRYTFTGLDNNGLAQTAPRR